MSSVAFLYFEVRISFVSTSDKTKEYSVELTTLPLPSFVLLIMFYCFPADLREFVLVSRTGRLYSTAAFLCFEVRIFRLFWSAHALTGTVFCLADNVARPYRYCPLSC